MSRSIQPAVTHDWVRAAGQQCVQERNSIGLVAARSDLRKANAIHVAPAVGAPSCNDVKRATLSRDAVQQHACTPAQPRKIASASAGALSSTSDKARCIPGGQKFHGTCASKQWSAVWRTLPVELLFSRASCEALVFDLRSTGKLAHGSVSSGSAPALRRSSTHSCQRGSHSKKPPAPDTRTAPRRTIAWKDERTEVRLRRGDGFTSLPVDLAARSTSVVCVWTSRRSRTAQRANDLEACSRETDKTCRSLAGSSMLTAVLSSSLTMDC
eukprot:2333953-Prymnesium_polylepis.5